MRLFSAGYFPSSNVCPYPGATLCLWVSFISGFLNQSAAQHTRVPQRHKHHCLLHPHLCAKCLRKGAMIQSIASWQPQLYCGEFLKRIVEKYSILQENIRSNSGCLKKKNNTDAIFWVLLTSGFLRIWLTLAGRRVSRISARSLAPHLPESLCFSQVLPSCCWKLQLSWNSVEINLIWQCLDG